MTSKPFAWSYSRMKNYEACPKRHHEVDILKNFAEAVVPGGPLDWGNRLHKVMQNALETGTPLPPEFAQYQKWVDIVAAGPGKLMVEQRFAITEAFKKTGWFDKDVWLRTIADALRVDDTFAWAIDWKTGKVLEDHAQMFLLAQCVFVHYPRVQMVRTDYIWIKDNTNTEIVFTRKAVAGEWKGMYPRVEALSVAHNTQNYPPQPGRLCKRYCPVTTCPYHGKGSY